MFVRLAALVLVASGLAAQTPPAAPPAAGVQPWTFLIYAAIDNNAEADGNFFAFFDRVRAAHADEEGIEVVLFADRSTGYSTNARSLGEDFTGARIYRVRAGQCERLAGGPEFPEVTLSDDFEPDSADARNVRKFLAFGKAHFPARHYALLLYGHADGRAMCPDEASQTELGFAELTDVVPAELGVDLMALELCNMGGIEIAYQWRPGNGGFSTRFLVAIPNAGPPLDWDRVFVRLHAGNPRPDCVDPADLTPAAFGALIVEEGGRGRRAEVERRPAAAARLGHEAVACYDLDRAATVKRAVDGLAVALAQQDARAVCIELRGPGTDGYTLNYARDRLHRAPFVDLYDLATRLQGSTSLGAPARAAAGAVANAVDEFVTASWGGAALPRFVPGRTGVYITFPAGEARDQDQARWDECRWYSPARVPGVYGSLAWCRDGATPGDGIVQNWFELLDCWYDAGARDGGRNRYAH